MGVAGDVRRLALYALIGACYATGPAIAGMPDPFAYKFENTPIEGPLNPAVEKRYSPQFKACQEKAVATPDIADCFSLEFSRQDTALNKAWPITRGRLKADRQAALLAAQRKWIAGRDPFCKTVAGGFKGGTIMPIAYADCRVEQTIRRTLWLEKLR